MICHSNSSRYFVCYSQAISSWLFYCCAATLLGITLPFFSKSSKSRMWLCDWSAGLWISQANSARPLKRWNMIFIQVLAYCARAFLAYHNIYIVKYIIKFSLTVLVIEFHLEGWDVRYNIIFCYITNILLHNKNLFGYIAFNLMSYSICYITYAT